MSEWAIIVTIQLFFDLISEYTLMCYQKIVAFHRNRSFWISSLQCCMNV